MATGQRHTSMALLWLIAGALDLSEQDTTGNSRVISLAEKLSEQYLAGKRLAAAALLAERPVKGTESKGAHAHHWLYCAGIDPARHDANGETLDVSLARLLEAEHAYGCKEAMQLFEQTKRHSSLPPAPRDSGEYEVGHDDPTGSYSILPDGTVNRLLDIAS
jgi:hypothetical protein